MVVPLAVVIMLMPIVAAVLMRMEPRLRLIPERESRRVSCAVRAVAHVPPVFEGSYFK
jgi:hypothetical protein